MKNYICIIILLFSTPLFASNRTGGGDRTFVLKSLLNPGVYKGNINRAEACSVKIEFDHDNLDTLITINSNSGEELSQYRMVDSLQGDCPVFMRKMANYVYLKNDITQTNCEANLGLFHEDEIVIKKRGLWVKFLVLKDNRTHSASCSVTYKVMKR